MEIVGPVVPNEERFSQLALRLRDTAAAALRSTGGFWFRVLIEEVALDGPPTDPNLVILLRTEQHPARSMALERKCPGTARKTTIPRAGCTPSMIRLWRRLTLTRACQFPKIQLPGLTCRRRGRSDPWIGTPRRPRRSLAGFSRSGNRCPRPLGLPNARSRLHQQSR